jgi:hypothetical protein
MLNLELLQVCLSESVCVFYDCLIGSTMGLHLIGSIKDVLALRQESVKHFIATAVYTMAHNQCDLSISCQNIGDTDMFAYKMIFLLLYEFATAYNQLDVTICKQL